MYKLNPNLRSFWTTRKPYKLLKGGRFCHALGTRVIMANCTICPVENVRVGDKLLGPDGLPRTVLDVHRGHDDLYTVNQSSGIPYTVNSSHILSLRRAPNAPMGKTLSNGKVLKRHDLGDQINMNVLEFMDKSDKFKQVYRGWKPDSLEFPEVKTAIDPYFMGLWIGDGACDRASITTMDKEIVDYIYSYADSLGMRVSVYQNSSGNKSKNYSIVSKERHRTGVEGSVRNIIISALRDYGVFTDTVYSNGEKKRVKTEKRIPIDYIKNSRSIRLKILAGIVDTDGTYSKSRNSMIVTSACKPLATDIKMLVDSLGFKSSIIERDTSGPNGFTGKAWVVSFSGNLSDIPCLLPRKKAKSNSRRANGVSRLTVESAGYGEYVGFSLDGDCLYLLEDFTVLHNSSKTHDAGGMAAFLARNYTVRFMCLRQFQNRISDSVYTVIKQKIIEAGWESEFDIGVSTIKHKVTGSEFLFYGIARNIEEIKGTEDIDICWIEEGEGLTEDQWDIIDPTIRKEGAEVWILWNPHLITDFVQSKLPSLLGDDCIIRHINYDENPFLSDDARKKAERRKQVDLESYNHIYRGMPLTNDDAAVIKMAWIEAAVNADKVLGIDLSGARTVGYDVADSGDDSNAVMVFDGAVCVDGEDWKAPEDELRESALRAWGHVKGGRLIYDSIGNGAHVGSTLKGAGHKKNYYKFNAAGTIINKTALYAPEIMNKDKFENLKAQAWQDVADRFRNTYNAVIKGEVPEDKNDLICIRGDLAKIEQLKIELSTPRKRYSKRGLDMVETKDELAKRGISSPNLADAFIMGACPHLVIQTFNISALT